MRRVGSGCLGGRAKAAAPAAAPLQGLGPARTALHQTPSLEKRLHRRHTRHLVWLCCVPAVRCFRNKQFVSCEAAWGWTPIMPFRISRRQGLMLQGGTGSSSDDEYSSDYVDEMVAEAEAEILSTDDAGAGTVRRRRASFEVAVCFFAPLRSRRDEALRLASDNG